MLFPTRSGRLSPPKAAPTTPRRVTIKKESEQRVVPAPAQQRRFHCLLRGGATRAAYRDIIGVREGIGGVVGCCCRALGLRGGSPLEIEVLTKISGVSFDESVRDHDTASTRLTVPRMP